MEQHYYDWDHWALDKQRPPEGDWTTWLLLGGRGSGKTRAGAEWVRSLAARKIGPIALVGETMTEAISIMVRGESGILNVHPDEERPVLKGQRLVWPNGVEAAILSASDPDRFRGPQFAAAWCDELGCGAVDKGANQPNIFGDDKSAESGRPYFSSGLPDPLIQRQFLRAHQRYWRDPANNPAGMLDPDRIYLWTWDARPYPAFPAQTDIWADGPNHRTGHWLTGRLGGMASDELATAIAAEHGVAVTAEPAAPLVSGYVLASATTGREALEPLLEISGLSLRGTSDGLHAGMARRVEILTLDPLALAAGEGATLSRRRGDAGEAPGRLALSYVDRERNYLTGTVTALTRADGPLVAETTALVLDGAAARLAAERVLDGRSAARETLDFALPPSLLALEPGDLVSIDGLAEGPFEIVEVRDGLSRQIKARTLPNTTAVATAIDRPLAPGDGEFVEALPLMAMAHLPPLPDDPSRSRLILAGYAQPWPGHLRVTDEVTGAAIADLTRRAMIGETLTGFGSGPIGLWDLGSTVDISLVTGHLASADPLAVLAGSNRLAVETAGGWEVIGFADVELVSPGRFRLTRLLRGLQGTMPAAVAAGQRVIVLDARVVTLPVEAHLLGEERAFRVYAGSSDMTGMLWASVAGTGPAVPLPPVHVRARRVADGGVVLSWLRRSRADGEGWGAVEAPLEHQPEAYRIGIRNGSTEVRTLTSSVPSVVYGAAEQEADFGSLPGGFGFSIAQISPVLGPGHAAIGEFHG